LPCCAPWFWLQEPNTTGAGLSNALDAIVRGSGSSGVVLKQPIRNPAAPATLRQLQEVVPRHAAVVRSSAALPLPLRWLMEIMGLRPSTTLLKL